MSDFTRLLCFDKPMLLTFGQPDALQTTLIDTLREARPTEFMGVPRVYEKFKELIE
jgi:long-subunit acyl-CoA synthetase (AMP-forming)